MTLPTTDRPTPAQLRDELQELILTDLRGPASPHEQLPGRRSPVRDWYLVGMLAPKGTIVDPNRSDGEDLQDDEDEGGAPGADDRPPKAVLFPSSAGMTFAVEASCAELIVTASWGRYEKIPNPDPAAEGNLASLWQRHPAGGSTTLALADGQLAPFAVDATQPDVIVRGRCRRVASCWLVTLFFVNEQQPVERLIDERWLFQIELSVATADHGSVFVGRREALVDDTSDADDELRHLALLYRHEVEFAVGHGVAVRADVDPTKPQRARRLRIATIPVAEVARVDAPGPGDDSLDSDEQAMLAGVTLDMAELSQLDGPGVGDALLPLVDAYVHWLDRQAARLDEPGIAEEQEVAEAAIAGARSAAARMRLGIDLLAGDPVAAEAFAFANHTMWQQRLHTMVGNERRSDPSLRLSDAEARLDTTGNHSWRPFQLAFVLLNLPALADPTHNERQLDTGLADLLFFPTGGGKTEAYLGLTAFTLAVRRLHGVVADHSGEGGVGVLMRYTLRLLTSQQFQRAATLICACEVRRKQLVAAGDGRWGDMPFRIGMWVGSSVSPNRSEDAKGAIDDAHNARYSQSANPVTLAACPWCGTTIDAARDAKSHPHLWRTLVFCGDPSGRCPFTPKQAALEGIPVVTVDEELYRLLPDLVIATADKFAQLPWQGATSALFGRVHRRCSRHGYRTADLDTWSHRTESNSHPAAGALPKATTEDCLPLRPPDLIIQDELHLIAGPLGSLFGLYETAIDELSSWEVGDVTARPKIVASTATIRKAEDQTYRLFCRRLAVFPPQVLDASDSFFAVARDTDAVPGRRYLGICAMGQRSKTVATRVYSTVLAAAQRLFERHGSVADPWMTTVGYFNTLRELGGMRRMLEDDVSNRLRRTGRRPGLVDRYLNEIAELTSRISSGRIPQILDQLAARFGVERSKGDPYPIDIVLATNMLSVGVDVPRLGLMICAGQPKTTAEYIQATSRVGRSDDGPGLVITLYNWARPRDLSHFETFEHYHRTYYSHVEALSVTPFASRALDRGMTALMVALARHSQPAWNPNPAAQTVAVKSGELDQIVNRIIHRAELVAGASAGQRVDTLAGPRRDKWATQQQAVGVTLTYSRGKGDAVDLLRSPESGPWSDFTVAHSLRNVEPGANLLLRLDDPSDEPGAAFPPPPKESDKADDETGLSADEADGDELDDATTDPAELDEGAQR